MKKITLTITLSFLVLVSLAQVIEPDISIYPNPFADSITYQVSTNFGDSVELKVFDLQGRLMLNLKRQPFYKSQTISLATKPLNNGIYFTSISLDSATHNNRIIKDGGTSVTKFELEIVVNPLLSDELIIYPNPTNSELNFILKSSAEKAKISLYNLDGKKLFSEKIVNETGIIQSNLNLKGLANGVYIIYSKSRNGELSKRIIKR